MKKEAYFSTCEHMYVVEQRTIKSIISEIPVAEKTVRNWKKEGNWDRKRRELLEEKTSLTTDLYALARKLTKYIHAEIDNPDAEIKSKIDYMTRLLRVLPITSKHEADAASQKLAEEKDDEKANRNGLSDEALRKIEQQAALL